tara:strand:- start:2277 stop:2456 length:180 start_codon:yes stop_codon:yes gene_type:complete
MEIVSNDEQVIQIGQRSQTETEAGTHYRTKNQNIFFQNTCEYRTRSIFAFDLNVFVKIW